MSTQHCARVLCLQTSSTHRSIDHKTKRKMLPEVYYQHTTDLNRKVLRRCKLLEKNYTKPNFLLNPHMETIWASFFRKPLNLPLQREYLQTPDGGVLTLDTLRKDSELPFDAPVVILIAGLAGGSTCPYVQYAIRSAHEAGMRALVFNCRGTAGSPVVTPQFYSASFTEDLRFVIRHLHSKYNASPLCAVGWSLGANILVNYLGEEGNKTELCGAISLCNPFDLSVCDQNLKQGFNRVYDWNLALGMQKCFAPHLELFDGYDIVSAMNATTIRGIDDVITRVTFGWESVEAYYEGSGSAKQISKVSIPLLCIQAEDDPISVLKAIPRDALHENENCILVVTPHGGHLGWVTHEDGIFGAPWSDQVSIEWFKSLLQEIKDV